MSPARRHTLPTFLRTTARDTLVFTAAKKDSSQDRIPTFAGRGGRASSAEEKQVTSCCLACFRNLKKKKKKQQLVPQKSRGN